MEGRFGFDPEGDQSLTDGQEEERTRLGVWHEEILNERSEHES